EAQARARRDFPARPQGSGPEARVLDDQSRRGLAKGQTVRGCADQRSGRACAGLARALSVATSQSPDRVPPTAKRPLLELPERLELRRMRRFEARANVSQVRLLFAKDRLQNPRVAGLSKG